MKKIKLSVPCSKDRNLLLKIYRSTRASDIDSITKIRNLQPIMTINEKLASKVEIFDGKLGYVVYDMEHIGSGINYIGPEPNPVPATEYESSVLYEKVNNFTSRPYLKLAALDTNDSGTVYSYSIIGVNEETGTMTELSMVKSVLLGLPFEDGYRELWIKEDNNLTKIIDVPWKENGEKIENYFIGTNSSGNSIIPVVESIKKFPIENVFIDTKEVLYTETVEIKMDNIWKNNSFSKRPLKNFMLKNIFENKASKLVEANYPGNVIVDIELVTVSIKNLSSDEKKEILLIKQNGIFYSEQDNNLSVNPPVVCEDRAIFSNGGINIKDYIYIRTNVNVGDEYEISVVLSDSFGLSSEPAITNFKAVR